MSYPFSGFRAVLEAHDEASQVEHFQAKWDHLATRKMRPNKRRFDQAA
ncbi:MAG: hypothetical protein INF97_17825 [Roseomonas sp.]|nr:hypothetical protein [Roseomonas sp.]